MYLVGYGEGFPLLSKSHQLRWASPITRGPRLQAPPRKHVQPSQEQGNAWHPENMARRRLTAVPLVAHVSTVVVKITPPDAVDTVPVAAPILVAETGILFFDTRVVLQLIALRALAHQVPGREDAARNTIWTPAGSSVVGLGQAQQAARPGHTGVASRRLPPVENLQVHGPRELARQNRHVGLAVFGSSEYAEL